MTLKLTINKQRNTSNNKRKTKTLRNILCDDNQKIDVVCENLDNAEIDEEEEEQQVNLIATGTAIEGLN